MMWFTIQSSQERVLMALVQLGGGGGGGKGKEMGSTQSQIKQVLELFDFLQRFNPHFLILILTS